MTALSETTSRDIVYIKDLRIDTTIGVHDWEREIKQTLLLSVEMACDIRAAAAADDLTQALDYFAVSECLSKLVAGSDCLLIETVAERCAEAIQQQFPVAWLRLTVSKPGAVPAAADVGVIIERGKR